MNLTSKELYDMYIALVKEWNELHEYISSLRKKQIEIKDERDKTHELAIEKEFIEKSL